MNILYFYIFIIYLKGEKFQNSIKEIKQFFSKNKTNKKLVETIFSSFKYNNKNVKVNNGSGKRLINNRSAKFNNIDYCFKQNFIYIKKLLENISSYLSDEKGCIFNNLEKPTVGRILSLPESEYQGWHYDFAPKTSNGWTNYFEISKKTGISPLSLLHFPEGGSISLLQGNMEASKHYLTRKSGNIEKQTLHGRIKKYSYFNVKGKKCFYRTLPSISKIVKLNPNETIIFR